MNPLESLKLALSSFIEESCQILSTVDIATRRWLRVLFEEDEITGWNWKVEPELRPDIGSLLYFFVWNTGHLESSPLVVQTLQNNQELAAKLPFELNDKHVWVYHERYLKGDVARAVLAPYLQDCLKSHNQITFDRKIFDEVFQQTVADFESPGISTETHLYPLANTRMSMECIDLAPGLKLRHLTPEEIELWLNPAWLIADKTLRVEEIYGLQCAMEAIYYRTPENFTMEEQAKRFLLPNEEQETINAVLGLIRLLTNGYSYIAPEQTTSQGLLQRKSSITFPQTPRPKTYSTQAVRIDDAIIERIKQLWSGLQKESPAKHFNLAFRRWAGAFDRLNHEDKLIDYWIGLESLFTADFNQEVTFRASLRIAAFLGKSPSERVSIYRDMQHSYGWRSAVVHGSSKSKEKELNKKANLLVTTGQTGQYLRSAMLKLIETKESLTAKPSESEIELLMRLSPDKEKS